MKITKNGFTLVELLGVITILAVLALIAVPTIDNILTKNKEKLYNVQIQTIKAGLKTWADNNASFLPDDGEDPLVISLGVLKLSGFVDQDITNPKTDKCFSNDMILSVSSVKGGYSYDVDEDSGDGGTETDCNVPTAKNFLYLEGNASIIIAANGQYTEPGFIAIDENGNLNNSSVTTIIKDKNNNVVTSIDTSLTGNSFTITYTYKDISKTRTITVTDPIGTQYTFAYTGSVQNLSLKSGTYKIETWGASGGTGGGANPYIGGNGGYSSGNLTVTATLNVFVYVGGQGASGGSATAAGGYNGGGQSVYLSDHSSGGGGGATDVRLGTDSLYARVIVAGGGGGGGNFLFASQPTYSGEGGAGGGLPGKDGNNNSNIVGVGGTISTGSSFGIGGSATPASGKATGAGGGGGWYGGTYSADGNNVHCSGGGGGSGWVYTANNFTAWQTGNAADAANWLLNSSSYLSSASTVDGTSSIPTHDGTSTMTGNTGNGYVKITKTGM